MKKFTQCAYGNPADLVFGRALTPLTTRQGLVIGGGSVYPELNFTVPPMEVSQAIIGALRAMYTDTVEQACVRAEQLGMEGFVVEFETLIEMTLSPHLAIDLTAAMTEVLDRHHAATGLKTSLRITPNDTRDKQRPPRMRSGQLLDRMLETFEGCARAGAEMLAIESTGGKEIHDKAILSCDIGQVLFALSIMGCRDMAFLWERICSIAGATGTVASGDTACGFGNTAMVLAEKRFIPAVFAAVVRPMSAVRTLVSYEQGAVGPGKDCGYENVYLKAITGFPMSMEGKSSACAHLSPVGNIAAACADLWSNESVQCIKLLGGMAPLVSMEQLIYDCRLMNTASEQGSATVLRDLLVRSDEPHDPQALVLSPENAVHIGRIIATAPSHYIACRDAGLAAVAIIRRAHEERRCAVEERELPWLDTIESALSGVGDDEHRFIEDTMPLLDGAAFIPGEYRL